MKKVFSIIFSGLVLFAAAQNRTKKQPIPRNNMRAMGQNIISGNHLPAAGQRKTPLVITNAAVNDISLGWAGNALGGAFRPSRSIVYADPNLNAVIVTHRAGPACNPGDGQVNTGSIMFDYSKTGGTTWSLPPSLGPLYVNNVELGRYPN